METVARDADQYLPEGSSSIQGPGTIVITKGAGEKCFSSGIPMSQQFLLPSAAKFEDIKTR